MLGGMADRVAVIGAGAIGGMLALGASEAGHDVTVCVRTPIPALTVERDGTAAVVPARIAGDPGDVGAADWVLLTTKGYQTAGAEPWLRVLAGPRTVVVVVQNGVEHAERLAAVHQPVRSVLPALSYVSAQRTGPGRVRHVYGDTVIVPGDAGGERFAALLAGSFLRVERSADFLTAAWRKLLVNAAANPVTALTGRPLGVLGEPGIAELMRGLLTEAVTAANAAGAHLSAADVAATMDFYAGLGPAQGTSMLEDRAAGRPLEYEEITGAVVRTAARHELDVPLNQAVLALLSAVSPAA